MRGKITKRAVDALSTGDVLWDEKISGFGVRARRTGKFYVLKFRVGGQQRWHTIGKHGSPWTPEMARKEVERLLVDVTAGKAPVTAAQRRADRERTVAGAVKNFALAHCRHRRTGAVMEHLLERFAVKRWGERDIASITQRDVVALLREVQGQPDQRVYLANRVRAGLSRFFKWTMAEALIDENPVARTQRREGEKSRERVLSDAEIAAVWRAADDFPHGAIVRLLLATGQRRGEVGGMRWSEIDLAGRVWRLPKERTKANREHLVPLNDLAVEILQGCPRVGDHLFAVRFREVAFAGFAVAKRRLDARSGVTGWRLHDLRRTVGTGMQAAGVDLVTVAAVLNHSLAALVGVTAVYARDGREEAKRRAMATWSERLREITAPAAAGPRMVGRVALADASRMQLPEAQRIEAIL